MDLPQGKHVLVFRPYLSWVYLGQIQASICLIFVLFDVQTDNSRFVFSKFVLWTNVVKYIISPSATWSKMCTIITRRCGIIKYLHI